MFGVALMGVRNYLGVMVAGLLAVAGCAQNNVRVGGYDFEEGVYESVSGFVRDAGLELGEGDFCYLGGLIDRDGDKKVTASEAETCLEQMLDGRSFEEFKRDVRTLLGSGPQ